MSLLTIAPGKNYKAEDLLRLADSGSIELVDGSFVERTVSAESSEIELLISSRLLYFVLDHPIAKVYPASLGYRCFPHDPEKVRKPDATVVRLERLKALNDPDPGQMPIVPDLAVEVLSPNDRVCNFGDKLNDYFDASFPLVWVVNPWQRTVTVYPLKDHPFILVIDDEITAESALPGFRCKVADFFPVLAVSA